MIVAQPGFPVPHHLPKFAKVHVHCLSNAIQPSYPLIPYSPSVLNHSQYQGLFFQLVSCSHQMTKILELQLQHQPSNEYSCLISLRLTSLILLAKGLSGVFPAPQFKHINSLALWLLYSPALTIVCDHWEDHNLDCWGLFYGLEPGGLESTIRK